MRKVSTYILFISFIVIYSCAQQGAPTGGAKDETPPVLLNAEPANYSVNFTEKKIFLTFDEFLDMGNFAQELVVSPPMDEKPEIKLRNKTLIIEFEEALKEDITYTFNFGEGIKDLNERNILLNFEYVFSTGDYLDSLSVKGRLKNAFDLTLPETPVSVMLYSELNDSLPLTDIPYYVGRADKAGNFAVNNLKPDVYKLFVLKDANNNFLFDIPTEQIAFLDSSLLVDAGYFKTILMESGKYDSLDFVKDTLALTIDTTGLSADTIALMLDSLQKAKPDINSIYVDLFMFVEDPENQFIKEYTRKERKKLEMQFNLPVTDSFDFAPIYPPSLGKDDFIEYFGKQRDSLSLWVADTIIAAMDTIGLRLTYSVKDTLHQDIMIYDTLSFVYKEPVKKGTSKNSKDNTKKDEALKVNTIRNGGKQDLYRRLAFSLDTPMGEIDNSKFEFYTIPDTVEIPVDVFPLPDTSNIFRAFIDIDWPESATYKMIMYPGAISNIYGKTHDTIISKFTTKAISDYGKIRLTLTNVNDSVLIQLLIKNTIVRSKRISGPGLYVFEYMDPATYRIKFVHDRNLNRKWDTGKYLEERQPEKVEFLPKDISVRSNWDHDVNYEMGSNDTFPAEEKKEEEKKPASSKPGPSNSNNRPGNMGSPRNNNSSPIQPRGQMDSPIRR